jgi:hypothetical protein
VHWETPPSDKAYSDYVNSLRRGTSRFSDGRKVTEAWQAKPMLEWVASSESARRSRTMNSLGKFIEKSKNNPTAVASVVRRLAESLNSFLSEQRQAQAGELVGKALTQTPQLFAAANDYQQGCFLTITDSMQTIARVLADLGGESISTRDLQTMETGQDCLLSFTSAVESQQSELRAVPELAPRLRDLATELGRVNVPGRSDRAVTSTGVPFSAHAYALNANFRQVAVRLNQIAAAATP